MKLKTLLYFSCSLSLMFLVGCMSSNVADKLAKGQALDEKEAQYYNKNKESIDKAVLDRKKNIAENSYFPPTDDQIRIGVREYKHAGGRELRIATDICKPLGFLCGSRVATPDGPAYFVGVDKEGGGWFHLDGRTSADTYGSFKADDYVKKGFKSLNSPQDEKKQVVAEAKVEVVEQIVIPPVQEEQSKPAPPPPPQKPAGNKAPAAKNATAPGGEIHADEIEKLPPIPPIPPLKEK